MNESHPLLKFSIFALVCIAFSAWIVVVIGNLSLESRESYEADFTNVQGLLVNDAVKISGVTVGKVTATEVMPGGTARVRFEIRDDIELGSDTQVSVRWRDVFGLRFLYLEPRGESAVEPGHVFPDDQTDSPADLGALLQNLTPVIRALDPEQQNLVLEALSDALSGNTAEVRSLIRDGGDLLQAVASKEDELRRLIGNSATVIEAYAAREQQLRGLLDSFADVSESVAERNDTLEDAIVSLADAQAELRRLVDANDEELRLALDEVDDIAAVLSVNHDNLEDIVRTSGRGFVSYHRISRLGQWFNIRAVGASSDYETISAERGATLPPPREEATDGSGSARSLSPFFTLRGAGGR